MTTTYVRPFCESHKTRGCEPFEPSRSTCAKPQFQTHAHTEGMQSSPETLAPNCSAVVWALQQDVSQGPLLVLAQLAVRASPEGAVCVPQTDLAAMAKCSVRALRQHLAALSDRGLISISRAAPKSGKFGANTLQLAWSPAAENATCTISPTAETAVGTISRRQNLPAAENDRSLAPQQADARNPSAPPTPPIKNTPLLEDKALSSGTTELDLTGGLGGAAPAKPKRASRRKAGYVASEETLPVEPPAEWLEAAARVQMVNGTVAYQWGRCRRHHIRNKTLIKDLAGRCETWAENWKNGGARQEHAGAGFYFDAQGRRCMDVQRNPNR